MVMVMKKKITFKEITTIEDLLTYLKEKGRNHNYYYHYTSWDSFCKIYNGKSFLLTRGNSLNINDQHEAIMKGSWEEWNKTYIGSFSFGAAENMAMWGLYGLPWEDAVRIAIPKKAMLAWIDGIKTAYLWKNTVQQSVDVEVCLGDMVYVSGNSRSDNLQLTHRELTFETSNRYGLNGVSTDARMTGHIKNYAWRYENEVRLHIRLPHGTGYEKILIDIPEAVLSEISITTGPSFVYKGDGLYQSLLEKGKIQSSAFENLVHYRPLCSFCRKGPFVRNY